ncbi:tail fiber protein [bacterium]|nr:tail fiber protein [bacterium]
MAKTKISEFDTNPDNNTDIDNINIAENCPPANINNAIRELMAQLKDFQAGNQASNQLAAAGGGTGLSSPGTSGNVLTSNGSAWVSSTPTYVPTGGMMMWGTASAPTGYLLCNGSAVSRSTYSALFAVIGTSYGSGDGSTTFNLPDFRDRFPVGAGTTYSANSTGGSKDAIVVSHTHTATVSDPGHVHLIGFQSIDAGPNYGSTASGNTAGSQTQSAFTGVTVSNSTTGSSGTNANLPPYLGVYFIIKT